MTAFTFVATFADGQTTRMSVYHADDRATYDLKRGVRLSYWAYVSRSHNRDHDTVDAPVNVPAMVEAHYEDDGTVLEKYDATRLAEIVP